MSGATDNDLGNLCPNPECKNPAVDTQTQVARGRSFAWCAGCGLFGPDAPTPRDAWRLWGLLFTDQTARLPNSD